MTVPKLSGCMRSDRATRPHPHAHRSCPCAVAL